MPVEAAEIVKLRVGWKKSNFYKKWYVLCPRREVIVRHVADRDHARLGAQRLKRAARRVTGSEATLAVGIGDHRRDQFVAVDRGGGVRLWRLVIRGRRHRPTRGNWGE